ncbi:MAG: pectin acetylesterase-family hydrolase [Myxococcota bacterium]
MRTQRKLRKYSVLSLLFLSCTLMGLQCPGLNFFAKLELHFAGVTKYIGDYTPATSETLPNGFVKHTFDTDNGDGPICIAGTPFTVFTKAANPYKLLIFLNGGGACWQDFYFCTILAEDSVGDVSPGIFGDSFDTGSEVIDNPFADYSVMFVSYCDGSVHSGDNDVVDPNFPFGPVRFHRGLRNLTAALDLAKDEFPYAQTVLLSGASAGGVGAAGFAPFLTRFIFGNHKRLRVFNDAGPIAINPNDTAGIAARAADWQFEQFYPGSCTNCSADNQGTEIVKWRLDNDSTVKEAFYSTDGDATNRFFLQVPTQQAYRDIIVPLHGEVNALHPERYKRFIRSGDDSHTALGTDLFYIGEADDVPLYEWTEDFVRMKPGWVDIVEDFVPVP